MSKSWNIVRRLGLVLGLGALAFSFALPTSNVFAATDNVEATKCGKDLKCVIVFGDERINNRLTDLTKLGTKAQEELQKKHISEALAVTIQNDVQKQKDGLTQLKGKLDGETDVKAAREDVHNVYQQFRIYAVVLPRDYRQVHLAVEQTLADKLKEAMPKIEASISKAPADKQGQLNTLYSDYKAQLTAVAPLFEQSKAIFPTMTPESFNTNRAAYETQVSTLKNNEKTIHTDLEKAVKDLKQIRQIIK